LKGYSPDVASHWLAERWDSFYTPVQQEAIMAAFAMRRLMR
jgi:hypothetical protein